MYIDTSRNRIWYPYLSRDLGTSKTLAVVNVTERKSRMPSLLTDMWEWLEEMGRCAKTDLRGLRGTTLLDIALLHCPRGRDPFSLDNSKATHTWVRIRLGDFGFEFVRETSFPCGSNETTHA